MCMANRICQLCKPIDLKKINGNGDDGHMMVI